MVQKGTIVGIDVAKGKIDAAIRFGAEASFANSAEGRRELLAWLKEHGVCKAVMEASGGYEKSWATLLRGAAVEVLITDRAQTLASLDRIKKIAAGAKATVIIQHDPRDLDKLPVFPAAAK